MNLVEVMDKLERDPRVGTTHLALLVTLIYAAGKKGSVQFRSAEMMKRAKINARDTFFRTINDLNNYGYLRYRPSRNHYKRLNEVIFS